MKTAISIWIAYSLLFSTGCSQTSNIQKGYAYARNILSGAKPQESLSEDGTVTTRTKEPGIQYFIYIQTKDTSTLVVKNVIVNGEEYFARAWRVLDLPVIIEANYTTRKKDTLLPAGNFNAWKIEVGQLISSTDTAFTKPEQSNTQGVLVGYLDKGNLQYFRIPEIKFLESLRLQ